MAAPLSTRPVTMVSPFVAGGTNDLLCRLLAENMGKSLGTTFVVDNRAGANGNIGTAFVAKQPPDGQTLLMGNSATHGTNPTLYPNQPFDALKDFAPVCMVAAVPVVLAVSTELGINSVADLIAYAKKNPGKLAFGSSGIGGSGHLCGEIFKTATKLDMVHVPYKGDVPAIQEVMGGQLALAFVGVGPATVGIKSGKVKALAVASSRRASTLPDVHTVEEAGYKGVEVTQWYGLFARSGSPKDMLDRMSAAAKEALAKEEVREKMLTQSIEPTYLPADELNVFYRNEIKRFREVIQRLNIKVT
ncbi:tripartite tricarboxylate transporter substrate binding protein [Diaphorobacter sp. HDW4A]|uniref:Bug family tripartite tricarboxylate transporter substrate binding protein n=1 Tax=Diaphorobacter sp. HDW4A TaxID=2714924 RepID=UPI00140A2894|nr:tripartite tricarboxylate transporter substrate-binding protein [Diaphorobacter sp. HDW4A]QIL80026.1 tripartite tricarboxylate transporter substrate binding protein [Diaphorobacter sp. HDW4A]